MRPLAYILGLCLIAGCDKKPTGDVAPTPSPAPSVDQRNTNYQAGAGTVHNVRKAGMRAGALNDHDQLGKFIELQYSENGKMPAPTEVKDYIRRDAPKLLAMIDDGTIVLTGTKDHAGLWAYEVDADKAGGVGLQAGKARRMDAAEVKQLLGK